MEYCYHVSAGDFDWNLDVGKDPEQVSRAIGLTFGDSVNSVQYTTFL